MPPAPPDPPSAFPPPGASPRSDTPPGDTPPSDTPPGDTPLIAVSACCKHIAPHWYHAAQHKYVAAVAECAGALPLLLPALGAAIDREALLARVDGLLFTGSPSNVEPHRYGGPPGDPDTRHDPARDETTLPLIGDAVAAGVPVLALCRGLQEMNVAFGGTLHQKVHEVPGRADHREDPGQPLAAQYGPAHEVRLTPGGVLAGLADAHAPGTRTLMVNSLHSQGVDRLAEGLEVEAVAADGLVEAFRVRDAGFALAVQWHPEYEAAASPFSSALFGAFGDACRARAALRSPS